MFSFKDGSFLLQLGLPSWRPRDKGLNILISTLCICADGFQASHYRIQLLTFYLLLLNYLGTKFENAYWNLLGILFSVIGRCSLVPTSYWLQGKCAELTCHRLIGGFRYDCTESQAASCNQFQCQNRHFGFSKYGRLLEGFLKIVNNSKKEQA